MEGLGENISIGLLKYGDTSSFLSEIYYSYNGENGWLYRNSDWDYQPWGPLFGTGDRIGCGFDRENNKIFFTKNAELLGAPFSLDDFATAEFYPCVSLNYNSH